MRLSNIALYDKNTTDFFDQGLGILSDAISSESTEEVQDNGNITYEMVLKYPIGGVLSDQLKLPNLIRAQESEDPNDFMIFEIYDYDEDDEGEMTVYAQAMPYRVLRLPFNDDSKFPTKYKNIQELMDYAVSRVTGFPSWFKITSDIIVANNLSFDAGNAQFENLGKFLDATLSLIDASVEYKWNRINILDSRGRDLSDIVLRDDKNTNGIKITGSYEKIINKVVPIIRNRNDKTGEFEDGTHMGSVVTSKDPFKWIPYYAGVTATFDSQEEANNYISSNKLDNPAITVDVTPLMVDEDLTQVHTFDRITAYSTKLKYQDTLQVTTRVFDQLNAEVVSFKMGSIKKDINSTTSYTLSSLASEIARAQNIAGGAARSADGKNTNYYTEATPANPIEGDLWFHKIDGKDIIQQYINGEWSTIVKDRMGKEIRSYVDQKMLENNDTMSKLNADLSSNTQTIKDNKQAVDDAMSKLHADLASNTQTINDNKQALDDAMDKLHADLESNTQTITDNKQAVDDAMSKVNEDLTKAQSDAEQAFKKADDAVANFTQVNADLDNIKTTMTGPNGYTTRIQNLEGFQQTATETLNGVATSSQITQLQGLIDERVTVDGKIAAALSLSADGGGTVTIQGASLYVTADSHFDAASIQSAAIAGLAAEKITTGSLSADRLATTALNADNITSGSISAERLATTKLNADNITSGSIAAERIASTAINADNITSGSINADLITTGAISADRLATTKLNADNITSGSIATERLATTKLNADNITSGSINASLITAGTLKADRISGGTLNGYLMDIVNINADNITVGTITGTNLAINLTSGDVKFQSGRIHDKVNRVDINIDPLGLNSYLSVANGDNRVLLKGGELQFIQPTLFDLQTTPYLSISNQGSGSNWAGATFVGRDSVVVANSANTGDSILTWELGKNTFSGLMSGKNADGTWEPTIVGGAERGVVIVGGPLDDGKVQSSPFIRVGASTDGYSVGNRIYMHASYIIAPAIYTKTTGSSSNVVVLNDGSLHRSTSASKYKTMIERSRSTRMGEALINMPTARWYDKAEIENYSNGEQEQSPKQYFGMIAEDLACAGLEELVQRGDDGELEGINYDRIAPALLPLLAKMKQEIEELKGEKSA